MTNRDNKPRWNKELNNVMGDYEFPEAWPNGYVDGGYDASQEAQESDAARISVEAMISKRLHEWARCDGNPCRCYDTARRVASMLYRHLDKCRHDSITECATRPECSEVFGKQRAYKTQKEVWDYIAVRLAELSDSTLGEMSTYRSDVHNVLMGMSQFLDGNSHIVTEAVRAATEMSPQRQCHSRHFSFWGNPCEYSHCNHSMRIMPRHEGILFYAHREISFYAEIFLKRAVVVTYSEKWSGRFYSQADITEYMKTLGHDVSKVWRSVPDSYKYFLNLYMTDSAWGRGYYPSGLYSQKDMDAIFGKLSEAQDLRYVWDLSKMSSENKAISLNRELTAMLDVHYCLEHWSAVAENSILLNMSHWTDKLYRFDENSAAWLPYAFSPQEHRRRKSSAPCEYCSLNGGLALQELLKIINEHHLSRPRVSDDRVVIRIGSKVALSAWGKLKRKSRTVFWRVWGKTKRAVEGEKRELGEILLDDCPLPDWIVEGWRTENKCLECGMTR